MDKYIGSQQHWEDNINADYDERERLGEQSGQVGEQSGQVDNRTQPDPRVQPKGIIYWFYYVFVTVIFNRWQINLIKIIPRSLLRGSSLKLK